MLINDLGKSKTESDITEGLAKVETVDIVLNKCTSQLHQKKINQMVGSNQIKIWKRKNPTKQIHQQKLNISW